MSTENQTNRCVVCGEILPSATSNTLIECDVCHGVACPKCAAKFAMHHTRYGVGSSTIRACPNCSHDLQDKGNKPINPFQYLGGY